MTPALRDRRERALLEQLQAERAAVLMLRHQVAVLQAARPASIGRLLDAVAAEFGVAAADLLGPRRFPRLSLPRQVVMFLASERLDRTLGQIGRALNRDHTTVLHGVTSIRRRMGADPDFAARVERVADALNHQQETPA